MFLRLLPGGVPGSLQFRCADAEHGRGQRFPIVVAGKAVQQLGQGVDPIRGGDEPNQLFGSCHALLLIV